MTSKCISKLDQSRPPNLHDHGLPVHLQTRSITSSKCISEFNLITASKCIPKLARSWPPGASLSYTISASKCISQLARSRPPSASLTSTRSRPPSASPNSIDRGLQVHSPVHTITASKCISKFSQSECPGAPAITLQYHLSPDRPYVYI